MERSDERSSVSKEGVPLSGLIEGLRIDRDNSVECGVGVVFRLDPSEVPAHQLDRSQLARHDGREEFRNREFVEFGVWQVSHMHRRRAIWHESLRPLQRTPVGRGGPCGVLGGK